MNRARNPRTLMLSIAAVGALLLTVGLWRPSLLIRRASMRYITSRSLAPSTAILAVKGETLYEIIDPNAGLQHSLSIEEIPLALRQAIVATEDSSFYHNAGFDPVAILRAAWLNWRESRIVSGASTITQQLARNLLMNADERMAQTGLRKATEAVLAYALTRELSKDEILALYLNQTYFGTLAYGVEAAARAYFGKPAADLDLAECALLAGLPQSPAAYNPLTNLEGAKERQKVVLGLMVKAGYIDEERAEIAFREPLRLAGWTDAIAAPHFCALVREQLADLVGEEALCRGGLRVHTTLDLDLQRASEEAVRIHLARLGAETPLGKGHNVRNAAAIALAPGDGAVRMMVGSPDYHDATISGAVNATLCLRQPGSSIKPITYAAAFARGFSPASVVADVRSSFVTYEGAAYVPVNYDLRFHGLVSLRQALACSYNVVAVKLLDSIGVGALTSTANSMGITSLGAGERQGLALTLGGGEVQLLQLTAAYAAFANGGSRVQPYCIDWIEDAQGKVLYRHTAATPERVLDERIAFLITDILSDSDARRPAFGEGSALETPFSAAVKTGTTTEWRDNWTVGYTTDLAVGVWVGNADNEAMSRVSGVSGAAPIWQAIMQKSHTRWPQPFPRPSGLVDVEVCAESGMLPGEACARRRTELFLSESLPSATCTLHRLVALDAHTGEPAGAQCPAEQRVWRTATWWPPEILDWANEEGLALPDADLPRRLASADDAGPAPEGKVGSDEPSEEPSILFLSPSADSSYLLTREIPQEYQQVEVALGGAALQRARSVQLWVDGREFHSWSAPPYRALWPLEPGSHQLQATTEDPGGMIRNSSVLHITVMSQADTERSASALAGPTIERTLQ